MAYHFRRSLAGRNRSYKKKAHCARLRGLRMRRLSTWALSEALAFLELGKRTCPDGLQASTEIIAESTYRGRRSTSTWYSGKLWLTYLY